MQTNFQLLRGELENKQVQLVAVSKTQPVERILELYEQGQRIFGENKVQEIARKKPLLPPDIQWHMIGHLQSNKVRQVLPLVSLIQSVDSADLLHVIQKEAQKSGISVQVLLQVHIAREESKFGWGADELRHYLGLQNWSKLGQVRICGLMGMATLTEDRNLIKHEFEGLHAIFLELKSGIFQNNSDFQILSMGMSSDYDIALACGSNMVRLGTMLFGARSNG